MPIRGRLRSIPAGVYEWPGSTEPAKRGDGNGDTGRATQRGRRRRHRHGAAGHDRHAGPADGQAPARALLHVGHRRPRRGGLLLPAHRRRRHDPRAGIRDGLVGHRLRRLRVPPRHGHHPAAALAARHRPGDRRPRVAGRKAGRGVAAAGSAPPARPAGRAGMDGQHRIGARVHAVPRQLRRGPREALPRSDAGQPLQRRLLDLRHHRRRGRAAADPHGHDRRRHPGRGLQG